MLRFCKVATIFTKKYKPIGFISNQNHLVHRNILNNRVIYLNGSSRLYSEDKCGKKPPVCKPKKKEECKLVKKDDCAKKKLPHLQECVRPNLMSECPQPACPHQEPCPGNTKKMVIIALMALTATLGALYYFMSKKQVQKGGPAGPSKRLAPGKTDRIPNTSSEIPNDVPYLLIGGGTAAFAAFRAIKSNDPTAKVLVITNEEFLPYMRPPLSKEMWTTENPDDLKALMFKQWNGSKRSLYYEPSDFYVNPKELLMSENGGVSVARGYTVSHLDVVHRRAYLDDGYKINYKKCLIATGSTPKNLDVFENASDLVLERTALYRTITDFRCLATRVKEANSVAVIGGGFLGSELACAIAKKGGTEDKEDFKVMQIFKEPGILQEVLPEYLSFWTTEKVKKEGVEVIPNSEVVSVTADDEIVTMVLSNGTKVKAEAVVIAVGACPNTGLAARSDLEVDPDLGGFLVNTELQARSDLYVAGDAACFYDTKLGRRRIQHHDNAVISGRLAGENMTGCAKPYLHQAMFWSDLGYDLGFEAIGLVDSHLPTVGVFAKSADTTEVVPEKTEPEVPEHCLKYLNDEEQDKAESTKQKNMSAIENRKKAAAARPGEDFSKGVVFYMQDDIIVGIVLWNIFNRINIARQVLMDKRKYEDLNEVAKLFNIHEE